MISSLLRKLRRSPFEFPVSRNETIGDIVCAPFAAAVVEPAVVDLGARNGMVLLPQSYAARARLIGFEPNREEYEKLVNGTTDARKVGVFIPPFKREQYFPNAAWRSRERRPFYVTAGPGACTLMGEAVRAATENMYLDYPNEKRSRSFFDLHAKVLRTEPVDCVAMDDVIEPDTTIDFLKLDVEGAELACLEGARKLLESHHVLFVYSEFVAFPYYQVHDVFGAQHVFLNERGYRLLDIELGHTTCRRGLRDLPELADRRLMHAGDAFFALDPDRVSLDAMTKQRLAAVAMVFGFGSFALSLLDEAGLTSQSDIGRIEATLRKTITIRRLKHIWKGLPTTVANALRR